MLSISIAGAARNMNVPRMLAVTVEVLQCSLTIICSDLLMTFRWFCLFPQFPMLAILRPSSINGHALTHCGHEPIGAFWPCASIHSAEVQKSRDSFARAALDQSPPIQVRIRLVRFKDTMPYSPPQHPSHLPRSNNPIRSSLAVPARLRPQTQTSSSSYIEQVTPTQSDFFSSRWEIW